MTREQIENLKIGDLIQRSYSNTSEIVAGEGIWGTPESVVSITFRGVSVKGHAYVGGYTPFGDNASMSFSVDETDHHIRLALAHNHTDGLVGIESRSFCGDSA